MIVISGGGGGDITAVVAGDGLSGGATDGSATITLDLNELTAAAVADGDFIPIIDTNDSNGSRKEAVHDLATLFSGTGLTATNSVIAVDAAQSGITSLGTLTGLTLDGNKNVTPGDGAMIHLDTSTITDNATSGSGTATKYTHVTFEAPTLAATNSSVTTTSAATLYINAAPSAGTNQTLTNAYALWVDAGTAKLDGDVHVGGDLTVAGDDITMGTNTAGHVLVADDTNFNPVAVSGDVTMASTGAVTIANDAVESGMLNDNVISGQTEISSGLVDADELLYSDGGVLKKVGLDTLKSAIQSGIEGDITGVTLTAVSYTHLTLPTKA